MKNRFSENILYVAESPVSIKELQSEKTVFDSVEKAVKACEKMRKAGVKERITVKIFPGEYEFNKTIDIKNDVGEITLETFTGKKDVILSGAKKIDGVKSVFNGVKCLSALSAKEISDLYVGEERAEQTRFPKDGYFKFTDAENRGIMLDDVSLWVKVNPADLSVLSEDEIECATLNFLHYWVDEHTGIKKYDKKTGKLEFSVSSRFGIYGEKTESVYYLTNVKSTFGDKKKWYYEKRSGKIYYVPEDYGKEKNEIRLPVLSTLFNVNGTAKKRATDVEFKNIVFAYTRGDREIYREDGLRVASDGQAAFGAEGVVNLSYAEKCRFTHCTFRNFGLYGVSVGKGCSGITVSRCEFKDGGAGGVKINGSDYNGKKTDRTHSNEVSFSKIYDCGKKYMSACGILIGHSYGNKIIHNEIHDLFYTGISSGWVWGYKESITSDNYIAFNKIYDLGKGVLSDMGGVYLLGPQPNTKVIGNTIYNIKAREYGGWAIYTDEGSSYISIENNVCFSCSENCFHQHYGKLNVIKNNVFFGADAELCRITRGENHLSATFSGNLYITGKNPVYGFLAKEHTEKGKVITENNVIYSANGEEPILIENLGVKYGFNQAKELGFETGSILTGVEKKRLTDGVFTVDDEIMGV